MPPSQSVELAEAGFEGPLHELLYRPPQKGEEKKAALVTFSAPKIQGAKAPQDFSKKEFAVLVIKKMEEGKKANDKTLYSCLVAQEPHKREDGGPDITRFHYHCVLSASDRTRRFAQLAEKLLAAGVHADVRVVGDSDGTDSVKRLLAYCLVPRDSKPWVDKRPFMTAGMSIPATLEQLYRKELSKLEKRPASCHDVWQWLLCHPEITTPEAFRARVDARHIKALMQNKDDPYTCMDVMWHKLAMYLSKQGAQADAMIQVAIAEAGGA
jgi:hypothetical protein